MVVIPADVRAALVEHAREEDPNEACGLVVLRDGVAERYERGRAVYTQVCNQCHKANGEGQEGLAPSLVDSEWALGPEGRMIRIVLHGLSGPITVAGKAYTLEMPWLSALKDDDIAAALTYVRRSWENEASPVTAEQVRRVRENVKRAGPWSERELLRVR